MSILELKYPKNRLRRTRQAKWIRNLTQESMLSTNDLVWPVFVCEGSNIKDEIESMKIKFLGRKGLINELFSEFKNVPADQKKEYGQKINDLKNLTSDKYEKLKLGIKKCQANLDIFRCCACSHSPSFSILRVCMAHRPGHLPPC